MGAHTTDSHPSLKSCCTDSCCQGNNRQPATAQPDHPEASIQLSWTITGMDCPGCAASIEHAISELDGVSHVRVAFATERLLVKADRSQQTCDRIIKTIEELGFAIKNEDSQSHADQQPKGICSSVALKYWRILVLAMIMLIAVALPFDSTVLFYLATLWGLYPVATKAVQLARKGTPFSIETLMSIAALGALVLGETIEAAVVLLLFMVGEQMEAFAAGRARQGVRKLMALTPQTAYRIDSQGGRTEVSARHLSSGDIIEILPGGRLPVDGELLTPGACFDESALTGESVPVERDEGQRIMAGSLSVDRVVRLQVISAPGESAIDRIIRLIEEAEERKAPVERFIDAFSRWYTPLMMLLASLVAFIPPLIFAAPWVEWIYKALTLLLIACPCALVISTPAAVTSALARAARNGALVKGGAALERLGSVTTIAFDKTGTLSEGKPVVIQVESFGQSSQDVLRVAAAIEVGSTHPLAAAIVSKAQEMVLDLPAAENVSARAGLGTEGLVAGKLVVVGSPRHLQESIHPDAQKTLNTLKNQGNTVVVVTVDGQLVGLIALRDTPRADARHAIKALGTMGIGSVMLTGDNSQAAAAMAGQLGMDYRAELLPGDKTAAITELQRSGLVAMIGDGINDAPALKTADIGIAMGSGTDIALDTADCALTHNRVIELANLIDLSRATTAIIRQNIILAVGSKALFLITTLLGMTGLWVAVLADTGATALVTANALRLLRKRRRF